MTALDHAQLGFWDWMLLVYATSPYVAKSHMKPRCELHTKFDLSRFSGSAVERQIMASTWTDSQRDRDSSLFITMISSCTFSFFKQQVAGVAWTWCDGRIDAILLLVRGWSECSKFYNQGDLVIYLTVLAVVSRRICATVRLMFWVGQVFNIWELSMQCIFFSIVWPGFSLLCFQEHMEATLSTYAGCAWRPAW